ncbi:Rrf2 family transcriptional regulator [Labrenzia sp. OB1]|uniref:Rrf2 family transcriptional regulator n=1 Tax=Labrenzia sp. OB1 TaxID=1561204 RepID=UPI0007B27C01|nr:Rrf2 family transcriptional regulator [Labrenzia sp. OB1]KZM47675.1 transcriptional regulator [Labrenzia sp. OB1]
MRTDSRLPRVLHVLLHLEQAEEPLTSEQIGKMLNTNPSLVRRTMAGLREAGFVGSTRGHGGGWVLERSLNEIALADVYAALGSPELFSLGRSADAPACLLERAANLATGKALEAARETFQAELERVTVADLVRPHAQKIREHQEKRTGKVLQRGDQ